MLIRYWDTGVQSYFTFACKIFGVARKWGYQRENAPIGAQKRLMCLKQKDWSKTEVPATSTRCPDHLSRQYYSWPQPLPFHTAPKIPQLNIFTLFIPICLCVREWVCVCVCVCVWVWVWVNESMCECVFVYVIECVCKDEACWYFYCCVIMFL